ncbi:MAG: hypothetical protein L3J97_02885 [Thermoplasmata archaeon]|nr:hypothetical protein [Thermoplasmata archaeon]
MTALRQRYQTGLPPFGVRALKLALIALGVAGVFVYLLGVPFYPGCPSGYSSCDSPLPLTPTSSAGLGMVVAAPIVYLTERLVRAKGQDVPGLPPPEQSTPDADHLANPSDPNDQTQARRRSPAVC